jgi:outer membrane receptor protein involved in Fe transport
MYLFALIMLLLAVTSAGYAQKVVGLVQDQSNTPLANVSVLLLQARDSSLVKGTLTQPTGAYTFEQVPAGTYRVSATSAGYEVQYSQPFTLQAADKPIELAPLKLLSSGKQLGNVTVTAKKPPFEQKMDRMVVNVQSSITTTGSTVLDVLEKSPGVMVDRQNNNITMGGKDGVVLMINGKINRMPVSAIAQMLAGMSASNIEKIELINTPPANFDAEGNAGYINIVFKTHPDLGTNGSFSVTMAYNNREVPSGSVNFNHRTPKLNLYGDYSYMRFHTIQTFRLYRQVSYQSKLTENSLVTERDAKRRNHNGRLGMDYQLSRKTTMGALVAAYDSRWFMDAFNNSFYRVNGAPDTLIDIVNDEVNQWRHAMGNINLQHSFSGQERLSFDLDYLHYWNTNPTSYNNAYFNGSGRFLYDEQTRSGKVTPINIWVSKLDYARPLGKKASLETGVKATISRFKNDVRIERLLQQVWQLDNQFSANYGLKEDIGAAYSTVNVNATPRVNVKAGLRYEYTTSNLGTEKQADIVDRTYSQFFPTFFMSYKRNDNNSWNLSYTRRITRPTFNELAPFLIFFDPNTFISGNAALQPAIANAVKGDYLYKRNVLSLAYTYETDVISRFQPRVDSVTNKQTITSENLDNRKTVTLTLAFPFTLTKWWTLQANALGTWQNINLTYNGEGIELAQTSININATQNFTLPKDYSVEVSGFYNSPTIFAFSKVASFGALNVGVQKKLRNDGGTFRFNVSDIFNTLRFKGSINQPAHNLVGSSHFRFVPRTYSLSFSRNFGNTLLKAKGNRSTGSEEERRRVE